MPAKRPMQLDDLFKLKAVGRVAMSPDGSRIVFELKRFDLNEDKNFTHLMFVETATRQVSPLTSGNRNDTMPRWSPDGRQVAFVSDRDKGACLFVMPMTGGEARRLTAPDGFVKDFSWSPDGTRIVYAYQSMSEREKLERDEKKDELKKRPKMKYIKRPFHKLDGAGWWNGEYTHVWLVDLTGGKPKQLTRGEADDSEPRFRPDGKLITFVSNRLPDRDLNLELSDLYAVKPTGGAIRKLTQGPGYRAGHAWSPDGKHIAYTGSPTKSGEAWKYLMHVWILPGEGGKPRELARDFDLDCVNLTLGDVAGMAFEHLPPIWSADSREVTFLASREGAVHVFAQRLDEKSPRCLIDGDVNIYCIQRTSDSGPLALALGMQTNPGDVYLFDPDAPRDNDRFQSLTAVNQEVLTRIEVGQPESFRIKNGSTPLHGWILKPPGFKANRKFPAILEIHGGPHTQYGHSFFHEMQWMAAKGYVVLFANPRGSAGYGLKFMNCIHADWGNLDYKDVMRFADHLVSRPYVDRQRVGVTGGSYGGYMTNWLVGHTDRFKAAVTQRSVVNLESMFGTSDFGFDLGKEFGGVPWKQRELYRRQSPLTFVERINTPLLIEHEEEDHRCPIEQAEQLYSSLKVLKRTVEMVRFEGESHGLSRGGRPQNRAERLRRILGWFDRHMR